MCYGSQSVRQQSSVAVEEAPQEAAQPVDVLASLRPSYGNRAFRRDLLVYLIPALASAPITYYRLDNPVIDQSGEYNNGNEDKFLRDLNENIIVPLDAKSEANARLKVAENITGFKLGATVQTQEGDDITNAKVVGFSRVDEFGESGVRKLVVEHTKVVRELFDPADLFVVNP